GRARPDRTRDGAPWFPPLAGATIRARFRTRQRNSVCRGPAVCPACRHLVEACGSSTSRKPDRSVSITTAVFYLFAAVTVGSACGVAFGRNILYSAFALMGTFLGVAATFVLLGADFLGVVQVFVYVGGILVLTIFAVMLTHRIDVQVSNRAVGRLPGLVLSGVVLWWMIRVATSATWVVGQPGDPVPTTPGIGDAFLGTYVLPFEIASVVLLAALIGAIVLSRKEVGAA